MLYNTYLHILHFGCEVTHFVIFRAFSCLLDINQNVLYHSRIDNADQHNIDMTRRNRNSHGTEIQKKTQDTKIETNTTERA